ncbi:MAG: phosphatase PAP2 family protein [Oscillospiraceae bacterium]|jgi:undecaprenyl-diphosphatase|nr:phosphatase PAP2 family protein [Oscillospiraceae bacterium]
MFTSLFHFFLPIDGAAAQWAAQVFHPGSNPFWDSVFSFITRFGDGGVFWVALGLLLLLPNKTRKAGCVVLGAMALDVLLTNGLLKHLFNRPRPYDIDFAAYARDYLYPGLTHKPGDASFPSGHTAASFAGAFGLLFGARLAGKKAGFLGWAMVALAALVGFSRLYLGVHYLTDILAGALVGVLCALLAVLCLRLLEPLYEKINAPVAKFVEKHAPKVLK